MKTLLLMNNTNGQHRLIKVDDDSLIIAMEYIRALGWGTDSVNIVFYH